MEEIDIPDDEMDEEEEEMDLNTWGELKADDYTGAGDPLDNNR